MAGRRKKPCEFCEEEWTQEVVNGKDGHQLYAEYYFFNNIIGITSFAKTEDGVDEIAVELEMNYCPKCGRKLEEI